MPTIDDVILIYIKKRELFGEDFLESGEFTTSLL
jgi:hypothetical protein